MGIRKILVNRMVVEHNQETGQNDPVFTLIDEEGNQHHASSIILLGPSEIKYDPTGCVGRRIWIETFDKVILKHANDNESTEPNLVGV